MINKFSAKHRAALIGLGTISSKYKEGIEKTDKFSLVATQDLNPKSKTVDLFGDLPFYTSFDEMLKKEKLDLIIISTPPSSHYEIIKKGLENNLNIIVEKPMVLKIEQIRELYSLANDKKLCLNTSYHWQNGEEIRYFNSHFPIKKISKIQVLIDDPYSFNGSVIDESKKHLEGSWIDSGVNALSLIKTWLPLNEYQIKKCLFVSDEKNKQPICSNIFLNIDGVDVNIVVDWRNKIDFKRTILTIDNKPILINHSKQTIYYGKNKEIEVNKTDRLTRHYFNYFVNNFDYSSNFDETEKIHKILLDVMGRYEKIFD